MSDAPLFLRKDYAQLVEGLLESLASPGGGRVALTDVTEGSVLRTLVEAFARELTVSYEQLAAVRRQGYLETAEGKALEQVVALVGVQRRRQGHAEGRLLFSSAEPAVADVLIPAGTQVAGKGLPVVETSREARLPAGQRVVQVPAVSVDVVDEAIPARQLVSLVRPILGISAVSNPGDLERVTEPESDDALRARARFSLRRDQLGTVSGMEQALRALGVEHVKVSERLPEHPGVVDVVIGDTDLDDDLILDIKERVEEVRPAGIRVELIIAEKVPVVVVVKPVLAAEVTAANESRIRDELVARLTKLVAALGPNEPVSWRKLEAAVMEHAEIQSIAAKPDGALALSITTPRADVPHTRAGDLSIEGGKRAAVERVDVLLQPPMVALQVDAEVWLKTGASLDAAQVTARIEAAWPLDFDRDFNRDGVSYRARQLSGFTDALSTELRQTLERVTVHVTRPTTGQRVTLNADGGSLRLQPRERLHLREVTVHDG